MLSLCKLQNRLPPTTILFSVFLFSFSTDQIIPTSSCNVAAARDIADDLSNLFNIFMGIENRPRKTKKVKTKARSTTPKPPYSKLKVPTLPPDVVKISTSPQFEDSNSKISTLRPRRPRPNQDEEDEMNEYATSLLGVVRGVVGTLMGEESSEEDDESDEKDDSSERKRKKQKPTTRKR